MQKVGESEYGQVDVQYGMIFMLGGFCAGSRPIFIQIMLSEVCLTWSDKKSPLTYYLITLVDTSFSVSRNPLLALKCCSQALCVLSFPPRAAAEVQN